MQCSAAFAQGPNSRTLTPAMPLTSVCLGCRHDTDNTEELKEVVIQHVKDEKEKHYQVQVTKHAQGGLPPSLQNVKDDRCDRLIDVCLYFVTPHCFTEMDEQFIADLGREVLVIPVCAKADAMTLHERTAFQTFIRRRLADSEPALPCLEPLLWQWQLMLVIISQCNSYSWFAGWPSRCCVILLLRGRVSRVNIRSIEKSACSAPWLIDKCQQAP